MWRGSTPSTAGGRDVVAHGAVDAEEFGAVRDIALAVQDATRRDLGTGGLGLDVCRQRGDLVFRELDRLLRGLRALHLERHAPGGDLEVHRHRTDAVQARAVLRALQVETVAGGAVGLKELLAVFDGQGLRGGGVVRRRHRRGRARVQAARQDETESDQSGGGKRAAST
jgi:hypothetical protein